MLDFCQKGLMNLGIAVCAAYLYRKLLHLPLAGKLKVSSLLLLISFSVASIMVFLPFPIGGNTFILALQFMLVIYFVYKADYRLTIIGGIISYSIAYCGIFLLRIPVEILITQLPIQNDMLCNIIITVLSGALLLPLSALLFRFHRLQRGMPFLKENNDNNTLGVVLSILLLFIISYSNLEQQAITVTLLIVIVVATGILLLIWWRTKLTDRYRRKLREKEFSLLENSLQELQEDHEKLSRIIHRDNKLIPAMLLAVKQFADENNKAEELYVYLTSRAEDRQKLLSDTLPSQHPPCGNAAIDALLTYMSQKAVHAQTDFIIDCANLPPIETLDLSTILSDLIENALYACTSAKRKIIQLQLKTDRIIISDSGEMFPDNVLFQLGIKRITSHPDNGGTGIGMMTLFELLKKYRASLSIFKSPDNPITKSIVIKFDNFSKYQVPHCNIFRCI